MILPLGKPATRGLLLYCYRFVIAAFASRNTVGQMEVFVVEVSSQAVALLKTFLGRKTKTLLCAGFHRAH